MKQLRMLPLLLSSGWGKPSGRVCTQQSPPEATKINPGADGKALWPSGLVFCFNTCENQTARWALKLSQEREAVLDTSLPCRNTEGNTVHLTSWKKHFLEHEGSFFCFFWSSPGPWMAKINPPPQSFRHCEVNLLCPGSARVDEDLQCKNRWEPFPKSNYKTFNEEPCSLCQGCLCPACYKSLWARAAAACCSPDTAFLAGGCLNEGDVSMSPVGSARHLGNRVAWGAVCS